MTVDLELVGPMSPRNQAAWWSPIAHHDGSVYVSYLAPNSPQDDVFVAKRQGAGEWTVRDTGFNAGYDVGHTQTSVAIDGQGYLHLFYGMHGHPIRYGLSSQSASVADGFLAASPAAFGGAAGRYTYPNATTAPNGDVYVILRDQRSSYAAQQGRLFRFDVAGGNWSELPPFAGQSGTTVYPDHIYADATGQLHIIWEWAAGGAQGARHYGSYARFDPTTSQYYRADGSLYVTNPITIAQADIYQGLEGSETFATGVHGVQSAKLTLDDQGRPMIAYGYSLTGTDSGYEHRLARWTGTEWIRSTVTPGPFDIDKAWVTYSAGTLRYYGTLSPSDPRHTGSDDIFLRTSTDYGATWADPMAITQGVNVQRPVGITVDGTDYVYLPDIVAGRQYVAVVRLAEGLTADFNGDGDVDGADFLIWQRGANSAGGRNHGDANGDGSVDDLDLAAWKSQFGPATASGATTPVPEPASLAMALCSVWLAPVLLKSMVPTNRGNRTMQGAGGFEL